MAPSLTSRLGRGLNLPTDREVSMKNANDDKSDQVIKSTFDLLEKGEKEIKLDEKYKDVILILGNTGSGKSTFTQWVAGDNTKMISKETEEGTGEYIIEDHNRISDSTLKSKTVFPELVVDAKTNAAYYDCPGFSDTQGSSHDIATTYFIKKVLDYSESVKMIFTISHPSVRKGVDRQDFMKLVRHVTDLVKDVEKFNNSIAIVATKVDNQYIKQGKDFVLVEDDKVIVAISHFLQESKQYLEASLKRASLSEREKRFYENAMKFVDILLEKEGETYSKIGVFRRPDMPGPVSDIPLLQKGKHDIERIVHQKLNFTAKNDEDFGYTVSDKTKIDINDIVEEINKNLWRRLSDIAGKIQEHFRNLVQQVRDKIQLLASGANAVDVNSSEAEIFRHKFSSGCNITSDLTNKMKSLTNPEGLAILINSVASNLDINIPKEDMLYIANQGKYFNFLQTLSDKILNSKPWDELFKDVEAYLYNSEEAILHDADSAIEKIKNRIQLNLNNTILDIQEKYTENIKSLEIPKLSEKVNRDSRVISDVTEEIKNGMTIEKLVNRIRYVADNLGISFLKENLQNIANQGNDLRFLEIIKDETLDVGPKMLLSSFKNITKYFYESEKWYTFLEDLYNKFSAYNIQKDRQRYNVANLEDWGQLEKPQGIAITSNTFEKFLDKIGSYDVTEYEAVKNITTTSLQVEELNQVLSATLKHRPIIRCSEPYISIKGSYISLNETMENIFSNIDTNDSCKNFKSLLDAGKYKLFKFLALNTVFIDTDLSFSGKGISVAVIALKWEVVGLRSISLNGADGVPHAKSKAKNGAHPGNSGVNGAPGNPGSSGESFFGIGSIFTLGANLKITSNGGKGSSGQYGGDGAQGVTGRNAPNPSDNDPECENGCFRDFKCSQWDKIDEKYFATLKSKNYYKIYGMPGGKGGKGGDGGKGGKGGHPGIITILEMSRPSEIAKLTSIGEEGEFGKAGTGGEGAKDGNDINAVFTHQIYILCFRNCVKNSWSIQGTINNDKRGPQGVKGTDGGNSVGLQDPVPPSGINRPSNIINEYKIFLRENVSNSFEKHSLLQFLHQLNIRKDVRNLYDTLALFDEFQGLEDQFYKLSDQMDFSSFYSSLLERINELAKSEGKDPVSDENKKVLVYLYTAILGRINNLRENSQQNLIIDMRAYLNMVEDNIKTLEDIRMSNNKVDVVNKYKDNYKSGIDAKIKEAVSLIEKQINPEIENISSNIDDQINILIEETITLQKQAEKDWEKLAEKKKKLESTVAMRGLFNCFEIFGGVVSLLGPYGAIVGTVIEATSAVGESLALNNQQQDLNLPSDVLLSITTVGDQIKTMRNKKVAYINNLLDDLTEEIKKNPEMLSDMESKIRDIKDKLKNVSEKKLEFKQVKELESEIRLELKRKGDDLKIHLGDKKSADALKVIEKTGQIAQFGSLLLNVYDKVKEDEEKIDALTDAMKNIGDKITKLREYEENIYDTIVPMLQGMEDQMKDISDKLGSKSHVALDVTKWQVQSTLKDMRLQIERFTEGFKIKDDLSRSIEKLNEVMTTLINVYDRIQNYQDQQNLANYIADISSVTASSINIKNQQLVNAVNHLEFAIRANIVLKQYKSAIDAFKQWVFPFENNYIEETMLPSQLKLDTNIQDLVQNATKEIETIKQKLDLYDTSIKNGDEYLKCGEFSSRYVSTKPFFVWKKEEYGSLISGLLSGKEVVLKADVKQSPPHKDAIKFREIDFDLRTDNQTEQSVLSEILKGFDIRATHLGNSYYRYTDKIFLITSDSVTISYSLEKSDDGIPLRSNNVYYKLQSGDLLLSPYTLWEVKMINQTDQYSYQDLESFKNEINVELSGFGSYVDTNAFTPAVTVFNSTDQELLRSNSAGINQCKRSKYRLVRSPEEIVIDDHMTNGASAGMPSPINVVCNFLKTYFISNAIIPIIHIFDGERISVRNYDDSSELPYEVTKPRNIGPNVMSNPTITDTENIEISAEGFYNHERIVPKSDSVFITNFDGDNSCSKVLLLSDQKSISKNLSIQVPDLNCSLLLADLITRTVTGNRYKSPIDECLLSPPEVLLGKISDGMVQSESEVKHLLQRLLSEKEESPRAWFSKLNGYAKSIFQFLGLVGNEDIEEYVQDVRNLFS
ncbi:unnamed protein product [Larinioides sclopetarius]|uniref:G domain-containing protein n=1 Tax=Larinioides sclopetarius TaxID=280406 RepID=A0AAV2AU16_9ARAC